MAVKKTGLGKGLDSLIQIQSPKKAASEPKQSAVVEKVVKKGRKYYGCIGNPECDFMVWQKPSKEKCPQCGSLMLEKGNKLVCYNEDCGYIMEKKSED